jgi:hypothetical protein
MTNQKCQLKLGQKVHGLSDKFKMICQKWLGGFFTLAQNGSFLPKISSKKYRNSSSVCIIQYYYYYYYY